MHPVHAFGIVTPFWRRWRWQHASLRWPKFCRTVPYLLEWHTTTTGENISIGGKKMHGIPRLGWGRIFFIIYSVLAPKTIWKTESNIPDCVCLIAWFLSVSSADDECICWVTVASFAILTCPWHGCNLHLFKCKQCSLQQLSTQQITVLCVLCLSVDKWI